MFVHPFDDPLVVGGQGTVGLEIGEDLPEVDVVVVPVGGGGLVSGIAAALAGKPRGRGRARGLARLPRRPRRRRAGSR